MSSLFAARCNSICSFVFLTLLRDQEIGLPPVRCLSVLGFCRDPVHRSVLRQGIPSPVCPSVRHPERSDFILAQRRPRPPRNFGGPVLLSLLWIGFSAIDFCSCAPIVLRLGNSSVRMAPAQFFFSKVFCQRQRLILLAPFRFGFSEDFYRWKPVSFSSRSIKRHKFL
jgi:hypothetical protein